MQYQCNIHTVCTSQWRYVNQCVLIMGVPHVWSCNCELLFLVPLHVLILLSPPNLSSPPPACIVSVTLSLSRWCSLHCPLRSLQYSLLLPLLFYTGKDTVAVTVRRTNSWVLRPRGQGGVPACLCQIWTQRWDWLDLCIHLYTISKTWVCPDFIWLYVSFC